MRFVNFVAYMLDKWRIVRRSIVYFTLGLTGYVTFKGYELAEKLFLINADKTQIDAMGFAAIIAALTVPLGYFAKSVTDAYFNGRFDKDKTENPEE